MSNACMYNIIYIFFAIFICVCTYFSFLNCEIEFLSINLI